MNYTALSLAQSPPLSVPLRYLLTAPLFLIAAALLMAWQGEGILTERWGSDTLALTHLITLGVLAMGMLGALLQLLPVLLGISLPRPVGLSTTIHLLLTAGVSLQVLAWLGGITWGFSAALWLLGAAFSLFLMVVGWGIWRSRALSSSRQAIGLSLLALAATVGLGLYLLAGYALPGVPLARQWTDLHLVLGLLGWILLLVMGVAYQVVPMFQITPEYPAHFRQLAAWLIAKLLLLWLLLRLLAPGAGGAWAELPAWLLAGVVLAFAGITLRLQQQRRRRLPDVTLNFWRLAMGSLIAAVIAWALQRTPLAAAIPPLLPVLLFLGGFALAAMNGMIYKIVPFLVWLHLNNRLQQRGASQTKVPNMRQIIAAKPAGWQFRLYILALLLLIVALWWPPLTRPAALVLLLSALLLEWNLLAALRLYRRTLAN